MIVDCFMFLNELELLEVRVNTLAPWVDAFILCEANRTFQGHERAHHFDEPQIRNAFGTGRPLYVVRADLANWDTPDVEKRFEEQNAWNREYTQRRQLILGFRPLSLSVNDRIILSDIDEIPFMGQWQSRQMVDAWYQGATVAFKQNLFYYWVNLRCFNWTGPVSCTWKTLCDQFHYDLQSLRDYRHQAPHLIDNGGWHFSYLGGAQAIQAKIEAFSHTEYRQYADPQNIEWALRQGWKENKDVFGRDFMRFELMPDDSHLPEYLRKNKHRFQNLWFQPEGYA